MVTYWVDEKNLFQEGYAVRTAEDILVDGVTPDAATKKTIEAHLKRLGIINQ
jgi:hypothetical protein